MWRSVTKPWFNGQYVGNGYSMPIAWQGWAVLALGVAAILVLVALVHGSARGWADLAILAAVWATIHVKRSNS